MAVKFPTMVEKHAANKLAKKNKQKLLQEEKMQLLTHKIARQILGKDIFVKINTFEGECMPVSEALKSVQGSYEHSVWAPWSKSYRK